MVYNWFITPNNHSQIKKVFFLCISGISCIWICAHCLISCQPKSLSQSSLFYVLLVLGSPALSSALQIVLAMLSGGEESPFLSWWHTADDIFVFFASRACCWFRYKLSTRTHRSFSAKLLSRWSASNYDGAQWCSSPVQGWLCIFLLAHFSCLLMSLWMAAQGSVTPSSVYPADLLGMVPCAII